MLKKYLPLIVVSSIILTLLVFLITSNENGGNGPDNGEKDTTNVIPPKIDTIRVFIETSTSMKGYAKTLGSSGYSDYRMKEVVPKLLTDLETISTTKIFTVSGSIKPYQQPLENLILELMSGKIFKDEFTELHIMIKSILDSTSENSVSFLISDCIPSLKNTNNLPANKGILQNYIYTAFKSRSLLFPKNDLGVIIFQYYSDFNGKYYYNYKNKHPYEGRVLKKRPFYIIAFGRAINLLKLMKENIFKNYENIASYGLYYNEVNHSLLSNPVEGYLLVHEEEAVIEVNKSVSDQNPISFVIGLNLSWVSDPGTLDPFIEENFSLSPSFINSQIQLLSKNEIQAVPNFDKIAEKVETLGLTHFIKIKLFEVATKNENYSLNLLNNLDRWIEKSNVDVDTNLTEEELEGKTFLIESVLYGFKDLYIQQEYLLDIPFKIRK